MRSSLENIQFSRDISEIHFLIANNYLYENCNNCEVKAIDSFMKSKQILENILIAE